jgi:hypothetical protein
VQKQQVQVIAKVVQFIHITEFNLFWDLGTIKLQNILQ